MTLKYQKQAVIVFSERKNAQCAIAQLQASGFPMEQVRVIGADLALNHQPPQKAQHFLTQSSSSAPYQLVIQGTQEDIRRVRSALLGRCQIAQYSACDFLPEDTTAPLNHPPRPATHAAIAKSQLTQAQWAVGFFPNSRPLQAAIAQLKNASFPLAQVRIIAQNLAPEMFPDVKLSRNFERYCPNFPPQRVQQWRSRVQRGNILLLLRGSSQPLATAAAILNHQGVQDFSIYELPKTLSNTRNESEKILRDLMAADPKLNDYPMKVLSQDPDVVIIDCRAIATQEKAHPNNH